MFCWFHQQGNIPDIGWGTTYKSYPQPGLVVLWCGACRTVKYSQKLLFLRPSKKACSQGASGGNCSPIPKSCIKKFWWIKRLTYKPKKYFSANQRNWLKEPILLQLFVEPDQSNMIYHLSMIKQMLCMM